MDNIQTTETKLPPTPAVIPVVDTPVVEKVKNKGGRPPFVAGVTEQKIEALRKKRGITAKGLNSVRAKKGQIMVSLKMDLFLEEFLKNGGNATQAALAVFNCTSIMSAANMGNDYLKKAKSLARVYMEKQGFGYGKMLDVATQKMMQADKPEWWDRLMKLTNYADFITVNKKASPAVVNVIQSHKDLVSSYIEGEEVDTNED